MNEKIIRNDADDIYDEGKRDWISKIESASSSLENNVYFQKKLEEQMEQVAERIINWHEKDIISTLTIENLVYVTGLSEEKIEAVIEKYRWKKQFAEGYRMGCVQGQLEVLYQMMKCEELSAEDIADSFGIEPQRVEMLKENLEYGIFMEAMSHGLECSQIAEILEITQEEAGRMMLNTEGMQEYRPFLPTPETLAAEELEVRYRKKL